jgi:two-component system cell cycle sensor histidine kinase/response regulator CckA
MRPTVLVVDDEPPIVEIIHDILESRGYRVPATSDTERALAILEEDPGPFDVLLTDVRMPQRTGPELAALVQQRWPHCKAIFMSGHSHESLPKGAVPPDAHVLVKPVTLEALLVAVGTALGPRALDC